MKYRIFLAAVLMGILFSPLSIAAKCSGGGAKPDWIDSPESVTAEYLYAAGVSDDPGASLSERIATAKQNALKSLSEVIEVSVKNSLVLEQSSRKSGGSELTDSSLSSITKTSTNASLKNVEIVATWEDAKSCDLWLRARVSKSNVEQGKREAMSKMLFGVLKEQIVIVQNESSTLDSRLSAVDAALDVLPRIAFASVPEASSADYYKQLLDRYKAAFDRSRKGQEQAKAELNSADLLVNKAAGLSNEIERSKSLAGAAGIYKTLLARHSNGLLPIFEPGDLLFRLAEVEESRGSSCGAKNYFQQAADSKQLNDRREVARKKAEGLRCSAEDMEKTVWRQYFEGRQTTLICYFKAGTDQGAWNKACDGLNNVIRPLGADIAIKSQPLSNAQLQSLQSGTIPLGLGETGKLVVGIIALGKLNSRVDHDPQGRGHEYQFDGGMTTFLMDNGAVVFSDRFQGTTGWNPISQEMVMDVLGINVVKRWQGKFSKFLRHELSQ